MKTEKIIKHITLPLTDETIKNLRAGDSVLLSGGLITARDAAHKRLSEALLCGQPLPVDLKGQTVYYVGPCPAKPREIIGSCGPTTSGRMDSFTPLLLDHGLKGMIGKGGRSPEVVDAMVQNKAVYFAAIGGAGALYAQCVTSCEVLCYADLKTEAVYRMTVKDFPVIVAVDSLGNSIYE